MLLVLTFLISTCALSAEGLHYLNSFPKTNSFFSGSLAYQDITIRADELAANSFSDKDRSVIAKVFYGQKIDRWSWAGIELPYIYREENSLRYGSPSKTNYVFRGVREPKISYSRRFRSKVSDGNYVSDFRLSLVPGLFEKRSGEAHTNGWSGSTVFSAFLSTGAVYTNYEARVRGEFSHHTAGEGKSSDTKELYTTEPFSTFEVFLDLQKAQNENLFLFLSSGIFFTTDYHVSIGDSKTNVQQGTSSIGEAGAKYILKDSFWTFKFSYQRNDFFTSNRELGNFKGDFIQKGYLLSWTKDL